MRERAHAKEKSRAHSVAGKGRPPSTRDEGRTRLSW
jgi:hypothetical protein